MRSEAKLALAAAVLLGGCTDRCIRNSDCAAGLQCIQGQCAVPHAPDMTAAPPDLSMPVDLAQGDQASVDGVGD